MYINKDLKSRSLGGSLLVTRGPNDLLTIERGSNSIPRIVEMKGHWTKAEILDAFDLWIGSEAEER